MPDKYITLWVVKQVRHTKKGLVILNQSSVLSKKDYSLFPQLYKDKVKIFLNPKDIYLMKHWFSVSNYRVIAVLYFSVLQNKNVIAMLIKGNRTFVKFQPQDNCLKSIWYNCLKSYSTIVKLFANKFIASRPYSTIVKKVHSHTGQLSKTSQMIFIGKIFRM